MPRKDPEAQREYRRRWNREHPEQQSEAARRWRHKHPEKLREDVHRWRAADPRRRRAQNAGNGAVKAGALGRPAVCEACGRPSRPHAHHPDYGQPLVLMWLCQSCHKRLHAAR